MPVIDHPTAEELREQRTWRVVTLCCESTEPDWHGGGALIPPGGQVLVRLQGFLDGRCGWTGGSEVVVTIDAVPAAGHFPGLELGPYEWEVRPYLPVPRQDWTLGAVGQHSQWLARVPETTSPGPHELAIRYRSCTWSGTLQVGTPAPTPVPEPTLSADFRWIYLHLPHFGGAVWWGGTEYDLLPDHWLHLPPHYSGLPVVLCVIDAQGRPHGAWEVRDTEDDKYTLVHSELVQIDYPPCDALK